MKSSMLQIHPMHAAQKRVTRPASWCPAGGHQHPKRTPVPGFNRRNLLAACLRPGFTDMANEHSRFTFIHYLLGCIRLWHRAQTRESAPDIGTDPPEYSPWLSESIRAGTECAACLMRRSKLSLVRAHAAKMLDRRPSAPSRPWYLRGVVPTHRTACRASRDSQMSDRPFS